MHDAIKQDIIALATKSDLSLLEAVVEYAAKNNIEVETLKSVIKNDENLYQKMKEDAMKLNLLKKTADE